MGTEKTEAQTQEQAQEQAKKFSLHQQLRKAKKAKDKVKILEAALEAAKARALEDEKAAEEKQVNKDRRLRAKHLYSLGVAVEYYAKATGLKEKTAKIFSSLLCDSPLADKDFARLCEAIFWLDVGIVLEDDLVKKYDKIKEKQKAKAELMRNKKAQKKAAEAAPE